jgi:hypothetical protein
MTMEQPETKLCKACGLVKHKSEFYSHPSNPDGLHYKCIECMKISFRGKTRPPLSDEQIKLLISMLDLLPDDVKDTSWIEEDRMAVLNPGKKNIGRLVNKGIVERKAGYSGTHEATKKLYRLSEDGRVIAKGMEALSRKMGR